MKHLSDYIYEKKYININDIVLENFEGQIISEGFWQKLANFFGFSSKKIKIRMSEWKKELKDAYIAGQMAAAKSDNEIKEITKKQDKAAEQGSKELLNETKKTVELLMKRWDDIKQVDYSYAQYTQLLELSEQENDEDGKKLAQKFKKIIDDKFPDGGQQYKKTVEKIDKSGINNAENDDSKNTEKNKRS